MNDTSIQNVCRLIRTHGSLPSSILYVAYFLPTSINAAWLSVASGLGVLIVPVSRGNTAHVEAEAVVLAIVVTAAGNQSVNRPVRHTVKISK